MLWNAVKGLIEYICNYCSYILSLLPNIAKQPVQRYTEIMGTIFHARIYCIVREIYIFERKDFMNFKVVGKSLILTDYSHKITVGEQSYDEVEITLPRYHGNIDNSLLSYRLTEASDGGTKSAVQILTIKNADEKNVVLSGQISSNFSSFSGTVFFMLTAINGENIVGKFTSAAFVVNSDLTLASLPDETIAEQLFNQAQLEAQKAIDAAERAERSANTPAPAEIYPATTDNLGGVKVDGKTITATADGTISALESESLRSEISALKEIIGFTDNDIVGLHADFENNIFTRLGAAVGKNAGSDFDIFPMYGNRKRCNVLDDGSIAAYYGDSNFSEDGSNGQVMVYQPKFYYKVVPLKTVPQAEGFGYHLRCANYYISATPKTGFKLHPAFYDESGKPIDYILFSAYEGSIFDTSANSYLHNDEQIADFSADKLSSVAGAKPCSGTSQNLTRENAEQIAENRGNGWHIDTIKSVSANQILMIIEFAKFNLQEAIGNGITSSDHVVTTGATASMGNAAGSSSGENGKSSVSYRGIENPWGNIWKFVSGINSYPYSEQKFCSYICKNFDFAETGGDNVGFLLSPKDGYITAFGYSQEFDWLFLTSETKNFDNTIIGDYYLSGSLNSKVWRNFLVGGIKNHENQAGLFYYNLLSNIWITSSNVGCRLTYFPNTANV